MTRKVKIAVIYEVEYPDDFSDEDIDFHRNESSWCRSNVIKELEALSKNGCLCQHVDIEVVNDDNVPLHWITAA